MKNRKICILNGRIIALFLFQYTLLIPFMTLLNPTLLTAFSGIILVCICIIKNLNSMINVQIIGLFTIICIILCFKSFQRDADIFAIINYLIIVGPIMIIFIFPFERMAFLEWAIRLAKVGFLLICWNPFVGSFSYMRFGYGMLPVVIFIYVDYVYFLDASEIKKKIYSLFIIIIGTIEILLYGARGALFALMLFIAIERFFINKKKIFLNGVLVIAGITIYSSILPILNLFERISFELGIYSYSITKFKMQIVQGFAEASSGRNILYYNAIRNIKQHPWIGNAIQIDEEGGDYTHNLFLQVGQDLGIIILIILIGFLLFALIKIWMKKTDVSDKLIGTVLYAIAIGRLMFSSTIWRRPEFWMMLFFFLTIQEKQKMNCQIPLNNLKLNSQIWTEKYKDYGKIE